MRMKPQLLKAVSTLGLFSVLKKSSFCLSLLALGISWVGSHHLPLLTPAPVALAYWGRACISSWSVAEPPLQFIWLICSWALASSTSPAALYGIWRIQQIPSSSARGAGLCPALKPAPAPQLPSALIHALPVPLCWNLDEAATYAKAGNHLWGPMGLLLIKMARGTWSMESPIRGKRKKMEIFKRSLPESLLELEKETEQSPFRLRVIQCPNQKVTGYSFEGRLSSWAHWETALTSNDWGHCILAFWHHPTQKQAFSLFQSWTQTAVSLGTLLP